MSLSHSNQSQANWEAYIFATAALWGRGKLLVHWHEQTLPVDSTQHVILLSVPDWMDGLKLERECAYLKANLIQSLCLFVLYITYAVVSHSGVNLNKLMKRCSKTSFCCIVCKITLQYCWSATLLWQGFQFILKLFGIWKALKSLTTWNLRAPCS